MVVPSSLSRVACFKRRSYEGSWAECQSWYSRTKYNNYCSCINRIIALHDLDEWSAFVCHSVLEICLEASALRAHKRLCCLCVKSFGQRRDVVSFLPDAWTVVRNKFKCPGERMSNTYWPIVALVDTVSAAGFDGITFQFITPPAHIHPTPPPTSTDSLQSVRRIQKPENSLEVVELSWEFSFRQLAAFYGIRHAHRYRSARLVNLSLVDWQNGISVLVRC